MVDKKWFDGLSYDKYKGYKLFAWVDGKFKGSGIKYLTNRYQRTHAEKETEFDEKAVKAFNLKVEVFAQKLFDELVDLDRKVTYSDVFSGNRISDEERARREKESKKRSEDRAKRIADNKAKAAQDAKEVAQRKEERRKKKEAALEAELKKVKKA
jgi:hypothetical protein